jgi:hypothetical protein
MHRAIKYLYFKFDRELTAEFDDLANKRAKGKRDFVGR